MQHMDKNQESFSTIVSLGVYLSVVYHARLNCTTSLFDTRFPLLKLPCQVAGLASVQNAADKVYHAFPEHRRVDLP
jgi:hypothetical protein